MRQCLRYVKMIVFRPAVFTKHDAEIEFLPFYFYFNRICKLLRRGFKFCRQLRKAVKIAAVIKFAVIGQRVLNNAVIGQFAVAKGFAAVSSKSSVVFAHAPVFVNFTFINGNVAENNADIIIGSGVYYFFAKASQSSRKDFCSHKSPIK